MSVLSVINLCDLNFAVKIELIISIINYTTDYRDLEVEIFWLQ